MSLSVPLTCPTCSGERLLGASGDPDSIHPAGILTIQHKPGCELRDREDATRVADYTNALNHTAHSWHGHPRGKFKRPITATEYTILDAWRERLNMLRPQLLTNDTFTYVTLITLGVVNRSWPHLWTYNPPSYDTLTDQRRQDRTI